jgi:hypothetical protein
MIVNDSILFKADPKQEGDTHQQATDKKDKGKPQCRAGQKLINNVPIHSGYFTS